MTIKYDITYPGAQLREELVNEVSEPVPLMTPFADRHQLNSMRRLWVLDQYIKGRTDPMMGPVMGPVFLRLVQEGHIEEV